MDCSRGQPFVDWLDVTCASDNSFVSELETFLAVHAFPVLSSDDMRVSYRVGSGVLVVEQRKQFHRASASGSVLDYLRSDGDFRGYCNILGSVPHKVTRLDVAVDLYTDAPPVLRSLERRYPDDRFSFGRKSLKVTRLYSSRPSDGALTGTWYVGHRSKARVTARVYDKQQEALEKRGETLPPTTRYELTFSKDYGCSLFDVFHPGSLFYYHASPGLLLADAVYPAWESRGTVPWVSTPPDMDFTVEFFDRRLASSPDLDKIIELAARFGDEAKPLIMRHFERRLDAALKARAFESASKAEGGSGAPL